MIKALATDLDGTLFYPKRKLRLMRSKNVRFLKKLISQGKKVILVTGRNRLVSSKVAELLSVVTGRLSLMGKRYLSIIQSTMKMQKYFTIFFVKIKKLRLF